MRKIILFSLVSLLAGACSTVPEPQISAPEPDLAVKNTSVVVADSGLGNSIDSLPAATAPQMTVSEQSDLVFSILSGEIAGRLGLVELASDNYYDASVASDDPRVSERATKLALFAKNLQQAAPASLRWVELAPENLEAWQQRARVLIQLDDVEQATFAIEQVVELSVGEPGSVIPPLVASVLPQADTAAASQLLRELAERFADSAHTQHGIGQLALSRGEHQLASQAFERALAINPNDAVTLLARARLQLSGGTGTGGEQAFEPVQQYLARSPEDLDAHIGFAQLLADSGNADEAAEQLEVIYNNFPGDADALYTAGLLALELRRIDNAERYLSSVAALDKHQDEANFYLAQIADSKSDYQIAIDRYREVQGGEQYYSAQIRAAELHGLVGEVEAGRELLTQLKSGTSDRTTTIELINAESRLLTFDGQYEESLQLLSDGIKQYSDETGLLYSRALVAERLNNRAVFETDLKRIIDIQPDHSHALNALGYFLTNRNERLDEAEEYLLRAHELSPDDAAITDSLGWLYYQLGRYVESLQLLKQAYAALPDPEIAAHLGEVLWVSGDQEQATKVWQEALRETPGDDLLNRVMKKYIR